MKVRNNTSHRNVESPADWPALLISLLVLVIWLFPLPLLAEAGDEPDSGPEKTLTTTESVQVGDVGPTGGLPKASDPYGDVTEEETGVAEMGGPTIADPLEPWNRAMYHFNDKFYFWVLKPVTKAYTYVIPEGFRIIFSNFYENLKAPVRIVNNLLQGKPRHAGLELGRFFINSTMGAAGFRDCAAECFGITGRDADFGQTLGKYGTGFGFYIVWPFLGPSSPRDTVGLVADSFLKPTSYVGSEWSSPERVGLYAHERVNYTSFHLGDYEAVKQSAIDPYVAIRDGYVQYRTKSIDGNE